MIILPILIYLTGAFLDAKSSINGKFHGLDEVNKLYRDANKDYVWWRDVIVSTAVCVALGITGVYSPGAALAFAVMVGGARAMMFFFNRKRAKYNRARQIEILTTLHEGNVYKFPGFYDRNGIAFFPLFRYLGRPLVLDAGGKIDFDPTKDALIAAMLEEARKEPTEWFK
jgi:hypothetical protein